MTVLPQSKVVPNTPREKAQSVMQIIEGRYIDREKLMSVLTEAFGEGRFEVRLQLNRWILAVPQCLTEEQIDACSLD